MNCPYCSEDSKVVDSRPVSDGIRRRRECLSCKRRFTTHERTMSIDVKVIKARGRPPEDFQLKKLVEVLRRLSKGLNIKPNEIMRLAHLVEAEIVDARRAIIKSEEIAAMLADGLLKLSPAAHERFTVNYKDRERVSPKARTADDLRDQLALFEAPDD